MRKKRRFIFRPPHEGDFLNFYVLQRFITTSHSGCFGAGDLVNYLHPRHHFTKNGIVLVEVGNATDGLVYCPSVWADFFPLSRWVSLNRGFLV